MSSHHHHHHPGLLLPSRVLPNVITRNHEECSTSPRGVVSSFSNTADPGSAMGRRCFAVASFLNLASPSLDQLLAEDTGSHRREQTNPMDDKWMNFLKYFHFSTGWCHANVGKFGLAVEGPTHNSRFINFFVISCRATRKLRVVRRFFSFFCTLLQTCRLEGTSASRG